MCLTVSKSVFTTEDSNALTPTVSITTENLNAILEDVDFWFVNFYGLIMGDNLSICTSHILHDVTRYPNLTRPNLGAKALRACELMMSCDCHAFNMENKQDTYKRGRGCKSQTPTHVNILQFISYKFVKCFLAISILLLVIFELKLSWCVSTFFI